MDSEVEQVADVGAALPLKPMATFKTLLLRPLLRRRLVPGLLGRKPLQRRMEAQRRLLHLQLTRGTMSQRRLLQRLLSQATSTTK